MKYLSMSIIGIKSYISDSLIKVTSVCVVPFSIMVKIRVHDMYIYVYALSQPEKKNATYIFLVHSFIRSVGFFEWHLHKCMVKKVCNSTNDSYLSYLVGPITDDETNFMLEYNIIMSKNEKSDLN